jgi:isopentenyl-diphosphate Delta-isomerase
MAQDNSRELVVLVNEADQELGVMEKQKAHNSHTPLHRAISAYIFDGKGKVIVQQRALRKKTWPGVWSNSCCGHPLPDETYLDAARREIKEELGIDVVGLIKISDYRYRFERNGVVENEICPVFMGEAKGKVKFDPNEVMNWKWINWCEWLEILQNDKEGAWSEWCKEEVILVDRIIGKQ